MAKDVKPTAKDSKPAPKETKPAVKETKTAPKEEKSIARTNAKPNFFQRMADSVKRYFSETSGELRKVNWPTRREATYLTVVVLVVTSIMAIILGTADWVFSKLFELILQLPI